MLFFASSLLSTAAPYSTRSSSLVKQTHHRKFSTNGSRLSLLYEPLFIGSSQRRISTTINFMSNNTNGDEKEDDRIPPQEKFDPKSLKPSIPSFMDMLLEIPDSRLFAGDLLFLLIINFLLQIASEVSSTEFWLNGGFAQPVTMPTTLLAVMVRDSKMSIAWVFSALWNRSYSSSSVADEGTAMKVALQIWVGYCSSRILLELGVSSVFTHSTINIWSLGMEVWYTAIIMVFFRVAYSRMTLFR